MSGVWWVWRASLRSHTGKASILNERLSRTPLQPADCQHSGCCWFTKHWKSALYLWLNVCMQTNAMCPGQNRFWNTVKIWKTGGFGCHISQSLGSSELLKKSSLNVKNITTCFLVFSSFIFHVFMFLYLHEPSPHFSSRRSFRMKSVPADPVC